MRFFKFLIASLLTATLIYGLDHSFFVNQKPIPAFGKLLNPFSGFWQNAESATGSGPDSPPAFSDLKGNVKVSYDDRQVPHIFAENNADAYFVQGYVTAQNRLWQMDISTRAASGRLSEVLGDKLLPMDQKKRRTGMVFAAENALKGWKKDAANYALIESYAAGVNAYVRTLAPKDYPIEFKILNYAPEDWTPLKTALFFKSMCETLAAGEDDLQATNALKMLGKETFDFIFPEHNDVDSPVIPDDVKFAPSAATATEPAKEEVELPKDLGIIDFDPITHRVDGVGSNNWAVAPSKTKNGKAILCGDPHLNLTLPSIWYEIQVSSPEFNTYGVSLPGIPGVVIGFNENIAWTQTNVGHDLSDWYTIQWKDAKKEEYLLDGAWKTVQKKVEVFNVKGQGIVFDTVRYTVWGPIVYDSENPHIDMALRWLAHDEPAENEMKVFLDLNKAKNYDDYYNALKAYNMPAQNFAFACRNGDIAIKVQGLFPIKSQEQGRFVQDGSSSKNAWRGFIPKEQNPAVKNPERGFISSANQRSTSKDYPYYYNSEGFENYRGRILNRKLAAMDSVTVEDMMKLQYDSYSLFAEEALPLLRAQLDSSKIAASPKGNIYLQALKDWNFRYEQQMLAPILFQEWFKNFYADTWDEFTKQRQYPIILKPTFLRTTQLLHDDPNSKFFDLDSTAMVIETAKDIATESFLKMCSSMDEKLAANPNLTWGNFQDLKINHLGRIDAFAKFHVMTDGTSKALNSVKSDNGPSWRMVVEMGDEIKAWGVYPGGESGNPGSAHYSDFVETWSKGKYYELLFLKNAEQKSERLVASQEFRKK